MISVLPIWGQGDIVVSRDISGGSSVFTFPKSRKARQRKFRSTNRRSRAKRNRTVAQRRSKRTRIRRQYNTLAKVTNRVKRIKVVDPVKLPSVKTQSSEDASVVYVGIGQYYINQGNDDEALRYYKEAVFLDQNNEDAKSGVSDLLVKKADPLLDKGEYKVAILLYQDAIKNNPENSAAYAGLGEAFDETEEDDKAIENYEKALSIDAELTEIYAPLGILYYRKGRIADADNFLTKALANAEDDFETQYFLGLVRFAQNRNEEALEAFRKAALADEANAEPRYYLGETFERLDETTKAIAELERATQLDPSYLDAWFDLGVAQYNAGNYQKAADAYEQALKLKNNYAQAYENLGDAYRQLADEETETRERYKLFQKANSKYNLAVTLIQNDPKIAEEYSADELDDLYNKYGFSLGQQNILAAQQAIRHSWNKAFEILTKAAEINPSAIDYANLGWAYYNSARVKLTTDPAGAKADLTQAKQNLEKALSMNPDANVTDAARLNLGTTLIDLEDFDGAISNLKVVTENRNEWSFANYALGVAYFKKNNYKPAIEQFEKAISKDKDYIAAYSGLGNAYLKQNDSKNVKKVIERLQKLNTRPALIEARNLQTALRLKGLKRN